MKALHFLGEKKIELIDLPTPEIRSDEVLIEIQAAGLCGSDLHLFYTPSRAEKEAGILDWNSHPTISQAMNHVEKLLRLAQMLNI